MAGNRLEPVLFDISDHAQIEDAVARIAAEVGGLDGVVNNAGIARGGPIEYLPISEWREQFEVNVIGQISVVVATLPLIRVARGRIVFVSSLAGRLATSLLGSYSASKFAIEAVGDTLRRELHPWGIDVSIIEPGAVQTDIWRKARSTAKRLELAMPAEAVERYGPHLRALRREIEDSELHGVDPYVVARSVEHALLSRRPKIRYPVGADSKVQSMVTRLLPDRVNDAVVRHVTGI